MGMRLDRFGPEAQQVVAGQIGPLANLRSSSACALVLRTDSPVIELHLARLRHHQPASVQVALQWRDDGGSWRTVTSSDLRTEQGSVSVWLPTGLSSGMFEHAGSGCRASVPASWLGCRWRPKQFSSPRPCPLPAG